MPTAEGARDPIVVYVHGIGDQPAPAVLKREWDLALFGREMAERTRMAYWSDILHDKPIDRRSRGKGATRTGSTVHVGRLLDDAGVDSESAEAKRLASGLLRTLGIDRSGVRAKVLPLPGYLRRPIARVFLEAFVKDTAAYFFRPQVRKSAQARLRDALPPTNDAVTIVAHSQGSIIALEVLAAMTSDQPACVWDLITIGSPLGIREVQDLLSCPLQVPRGIRRWHNFADPLDMVALDKRIATDFDDGDMITDELVLNTRIRRLEKFDPHSAVGYLAHPRVREVVHTAARIDTHARFLVARDVAAELAVDDRHAVLIEILEPGYPAVDETEDSMRAHEREVEKGQTDLATRVRRAAELVEEIVRECAAERGIRAAERGSRAEVENALEEARIDELRRFVAARLTPDEICAVAEKHRKLRMYAMWKSSAKRKLLNRSYRVIQADAALASYSAEGEGIRWAVLDTGIRRDHPHFGTHGNIIEVWDCTKKGRPKALADDRDKDGHGTHVAGIIAGTAPHGVSRGDEGLRGIAPRAKLVVYKVLDDCGGGEDAWIIKALDHIAEQNENNSEILIHGVNLSLGGPYDSTVYGCGFTPICVELRRLWRAGALVVVACGNEGQSEVMTPDGEVEINTVMSIGDPANLEDCIAVGSVNADRPHLYGVSAFSSRGPTTDGRLKPDVIAPGERIRSCNARFSAERPEAFYRQESGTSMAAPHVSGLLAAFLSVRREFRGRPDEVKEILLRTCMDIQRDRYHQGHGIPNLMRMLLDA